MPIVISVTLLGLGQVKSVKLGSLKQIYDYLKLHVQNFLKKNMYQWGKLMTT